MERGTVVVVEDDPHIAELVELYLRRDGFRVLRRSTGESALDAVRDERPRLVVLDVGLPDVDGFEVCRRLRAFSDVPVIFLPARGDEVDRVLGLELGADDYLPKPFSPAELAARVRAVIRRAEAAPAAVLPDDDEVIGIGTVEVDGGRRELRVEGTVVETTAREFALLRFLAENPGRALSRQQILDGAWGYDWYGDARTVDVHVAQVRRKLGGAATITTVRGHGYRLEPAPVDRPSGSR